jgi:hypothetical protein
MKGASEASSLIVCSVIFAALLTTHVELVEAGV